MTPEPPFRITARRLPLPLLVVLGLTCFHGQAAASTIVTLGQQGRIIFAADRYAYGRGYAGEAGAAMIPVRKLFPLPDENAVVIYYGATGYLKDVEQSDGRVRRVPYNFDPIISSSLGLATSDGDPDCRAGVERATGANAGEKLSAVADSIQACWRLGTTSGTVFLDAAYFDEHGRPTIHGCKITREDSAQCKTVTLLSPRSAGDALEFDTRAGNPKHQEIAVFGVQASIERILKGADHWLTGSNSHPLWPVGGILGRAIAERNECTDAQQRAGCEFGIASGRIETIALDVLLVSRTRAAYLQSLREMKTQVERLQADPVTAGSDMWAAWMTPGLRIWLATYDQYGKVLLERRPDLAEHQALTAALAEIREYRLPGSVELPAALAETLHELETLLVLARGIAQPQGLISRLEGWERSLAEMQRQPGRSLSPVDARLIARAAATVTEHRRIRAAIEAAQSVLTREREFLIGLVDYHGFLEDLDGADAAPMAIVALERMRDRLADEGFDAAAARKFLGRSRETLDAWGILEGNVDSADLARLGRVRGANLADLHRASALSIDTAERLSLPDACKTAVDLVLAQLSRIRFGSSSPIDRMTGQALEGLDLTPLPDVDVGVLEQDGGYVRLEWDFANQRCIVSDVDGERDRLKTAIRGQRGQCRDDGPLAPLKSDIDLDGCVTGRDLAVLEPDLDEDGDGVINRLDNCVLDANGPAVGGGGGQLDRDYDGWGDPCDCAPDDPHVFLCRG